MGADKRAEALAVVGDRIFAVGTRDEIMKLKGPETKIVDLDGHFVMPGFNDAHMHLASAGLEKMNVNLVGVKTLDEFRERLRAKVRSRRARRVGSRRRLGRDSVAGQRVCLRDGIWTR